MLRKIISTKASLYSLKSLLTRFLATSTIGIVSSTMIIVGLYGSSQIMTIGFKFYCIIIFTYQCISEGIVFIHYLLDKKYPNFNDLYKRFGKQITYSIIWFLIVFISSFLLKRKGLGNNTETFRTFLFFVAFGAFFVYIMTLDLLSVKVIIGYRKAEKNIERLKREKLILAYQSLADQVNPHFLFNNLSVLISEIQYNQKNAVEFTQRLSNIYRYVLDIKDKIIVDLQNEANIARDYIFLHKTRLGDGLKVVFPENTNMENMVIPPLALQTLIENAIKHNITDANKPLTIELYCENSNICVKNNLQPKKCSYSTNTGLSNLKKRYSILGNYKLEIIKTESHFLVKVPILSKDKYYR